MTFRALRPSNPLLGFRFAVTFAETSSPAAAIASGAVAQVAAGFSEISGLGSSLEIHEYREGGRNDFTHKFATRGNHSNITLRRGVAFVPDLFEWYNRVQGGSFGARREILIAHLDTEGSPAQVWYVSRALPTRYTGPSWDASQSSVAVEGLEIAYEGLELVPGANFGLRLEVQASVGVGV